LDRGIPPNSDSAGKGEAMKTVACSHFWQHLDSYPETRQFKARCKWCGEVSLIQGHVGPFSATDTNVEIAWSELDLKQKAIIVGAAIVLSFYLMLYNRRGW
jgi:hypothetical protein